MKISKTDSGNFLIECDRNELTILSNALNNIPQAVDEGEYTTLIGATKVDTNKILDTLVNVISDS